MSDGALEGCGGGLVGECQHDDGRQAERSFVSHKTEDGRIEYVCDHLREVAEMAAEFARHFGAEGWARTAGMAHDIGKYSPEFQNRILRGGHKVDHSTAGAYELFEHLNAKLLAYCVAGHHGGLPDGGSPVDVSSGSTLLSRIKGAREGGLPDHHAFAGEVELPIAGKLAFRTPPDPKDGFALAFLTRMVFSCLVDADFLCTERFMQGGAREQLSVEGLDVLCERLEAKIASFYPPKTELNETRCNLLDACSRAAEEAPGVFSLTVPTGGGKTYASMRFALRHALADGHGMRRVIYAVPYTSIIEQNAAVFREVLGERNVLEHHANFDFDDVGEDGNALRLAAENWDAPIVVTTNVQLFESLFANKTSRCRKLHSIAGSVIVLDEAQMLPTKQLLPCVRALAELVKRYGCTVVLCTATQPSLGELFERFDCPVREIAPDPQRLYERLRRTTYCFDGAVEDEDLASRLAANDQVLCVVNSRKQAKRLYDLMIAASNEADGVFHLSTLMHPVHRERVLKEVRRRLRNGEACRVVSTSLVEAGVDVDFPVVYRALAGIDSVVQCAGRCNREGRRDAQESVVHLFEPAEPYALPADVRQKAELARQVLRNAGVGMDGGGGSYDIGSLEVIAAYFDQLHEIRRDRLDASAALADLALLRVSGGAPCIPFKSVAEHFRMIEEGSHSVIVPDPDIADAISEVKAGRVMRGTMRRLARYSVGLYDNDLKALASAHSVELLEGDMYVLLDCELYHEDTGLDASDAGGKGLFF